MPWLTIHPLGISLVVTSSRKAALIGFAVDAYISTGEPQPEGPSAGARAQRAGESWKWWGWQGRGFTSKVEGAVDAHCWLLLELSQALGGSFVHHQVQGLVQHHQLHAVKLPVVHRLHAGQERKREVGRVPSTAGTGLRT